MVKLEYLILFKNSGIPIYSHCFGNFCSLLLRDEVLLTGFLSALTALKDVRGDEREYFKSLNFEGQEMKLEFSDEGNLLAIDVGGTKLVFYIMETQENIIVTGFQKDGFIYDRNIAEIDKINNSIKLFLEDKYENKNWYKVTLDELDAFENDLLDNILHPWMNDNDSLHTCQFGDKCPLRVAILPLSESKGIVERIRDTIYDYRKKGFLFKMRMVMSKVKAKFK